MANAIAAAAHFDWLAIFVSQVRLPISVAELAPWPGLFEPVHLLEQGTKTGKSGNGNEWQ